MKFDASTWPRMLATLPALEAKADKTLAVAFVASEDHAARQGTAWLWWGAGQPVQRCAYDGRFPADWGLLLVMSEAAIDGICAEGESCMAGLVRRGKIMPFVLQSRQALEDAGVLDFIETLELATPKH